MQNRFYSRNSKNIHRLSALNVASFAFSILAFVSAAQAAEYYFRRPGSEVHYKLSGDSFAIDSVGQRVLAGGCGRIDNLTSNYNSTALDRWVTISQIQPNITLARNRDTYSHDGLLDCINNLFELALPKDENSNNLTTVAICVLLIPLLSTIAIYIGCRIDLAKRGPNSCMERFFQHDDRQEAEPLEEVKVPDIDF